VSLLFRRRRLSSSSLSSLFVFRFALDCDSLVLLLVLSVDLEAEKLTFWGRSGRVDDESNNRESGRLLSLLVVLVLVSRVLLSCSSKLELFVVALVPNKLCVNDSFILVEGVSYSIG